MDIKIPESLLTVDKGTKEELVMILQAISPYVVVTGSYARGAQTDMSDIDLCIKEMPEDEINYEASYVEDTYCKPLIRLFERIHHKWGSVMIGSFHVEDTFIPLEFSDFYTIDDDMFEIEILGVKMTAALSHHTSENYIDGQKRRK